MSDNTGYRFGWSDPTKMSLSELFLDWYTKGTWTDELEREYQVFNKDPGNYHPKRLEDS